MPHIVVNVWPGRSDEEKKTLANRIALDVADTFEMDTEYVSVSFEEVPEAEWDASASGRLRINRMASTKAWEPALPL